MAKLSEAEELELLELENENAIASGGLKDAPREIGMLERAAPTISALARPALEATGALGGAALAGASALPTGPGAALAAAGGGALGFAGGKAAADLLDRSLGVKPPIRSIGEAVKETGENIQDGAMAEAMGLGTGAALKAIPSALVKAGTSMPSRKGITALTGVSGENQALRFARNPEVRAAKSIEALGEEFPATVTELNKKVSELSTKALSKLSRSIDPQRGGRMRFDVEKAIYAEKEALADGISDAGANAGKVLDRYIERLNGLANKLSEHDLGKMVRDIDNDIDWDKVDRKPANEALQRVRIAIDEMLKGKNTAYAEAMRPTAEATDVLDKVKQLFLLKKHAGGVLGPGDGTVGKLKGATAESRLQSHSVLEGLKKFTGRDYAREIENTLAAEAFRGGKAQGSRRTGPFTVIATSVGAGLGGAVGGPSGFAAGSAAAGVPAYLVGSHLDDHGHEIAGSLIDKLYQISQRRGARVPSAAFQQALRAAAAASPKPSTENR